MKSITKLFILSIFTMLAGCGNENALPEYNGVYARYYDGTLIKLEGHQFSHSAWLDIKGSISMSVISKARSKRRDYVVSKPTTTLDMSKVNAFIVHGGEHKQPGFPKWLISYYVATKDAEGKVFENTGSGTKGNMYMTTDACGTSDGMLYKEEKPNMFVFQYPVEESGDFKFCNLKDGKPTTYAADGSGKNNVWLPKAQSVAFYGIRHDGLFYTFFAK
jgi:hypothetical protein